MGFGGAVGRLIELRQRQRRAQLETPRFLLCAMAMAVRKASSAGTGLAGSRLSRISPRMRCDVRLTPMLAGAFAIGET